MTRRAALCALLCAGALCAGSAAAADEPVIQPGSGSFHFDQWAGSALRVFYFVPASVQPDTRVVFVSHGLKRNADVYRDQWAPLAKEHGLVVAVPEFSQADFPRMLGYNLGHVFGEDGKLRPREKWAFSAIEPIFDFLRANLDLQTASYAMYGHSAGAQFVSRYLYYVPDARIFSVVAANAGWYTMPDVSTEYPFGMVGSSLNRSMLTQALQRPLQILLGEKDNDPKHKFLNKSPGAQAQGPHRLARGKAFYEAGRVQAERTGIKLGWSLKTVPGVGHSNRRMAPTAVQHLLAPGQGS